MKTAGVRVALAAVAAAAAGCALALVALAGLLERRPDPPPSFDEVRGRWCPSDVRVLDRHGEVLHELRIHPKGRRLAWTPLADVSPALVRAVLASEDHRFFSHGGVDWLAAASAAARMATGGPARGASTIPMQLASLLDPGLRARAGRRGLVEKWDQARAALALDDRWTKDEILEAYLNLVTFRGEVEGVAAAADAIFGKSPDALTAAEGAVLAASIRSPNAPADELAARAGRLVAAATRGDEAKLDPASARREAADVRPDAAEAALEAAVSRATAPPDSRAARTTLAPHAARQLVRGAPPCRDVRSTIDARLQAVASSSLERHLGELADRSARDGAVLVVDNASGEVLAYVGSSGERSGAREVDGVTARRQAGSALKPFLYARAIDRGLVTPATLVPDEPLEIASGGDLYRPSNYDRSFRGLVSVRTALASSLNVPAVRTLLLVGEDEFADTLRALGLRGVDRRGTWYGPSLALGSADVSLFDMVGAYRALADGGTWSPLAWKGGDPSQRRRVFSPEAAFLVADILADRQGRAATFELASPLATRFWTAVKTGTSKDMRDNWCVGFSRRFTVGVWVGNFSGEPMHDVSGITGAAPVWHEVMEFLHEDLPSDAPEPPDGIVSAWTAFAGDVEPARPELYRRGTEPVAPRAGRLDDAARISAPTDGSVFAIDPDVSASRRRLVLVARGAREGLSWTMDGRAVGGAAMPLAWEPTKGRHELVLVDADARPLDTVRFVVR